MGKSKKPFIDKKNASTYHLLYRSQRDVAGADGESGDPGVILWPSPGNNKAIDEKVLLGKSSASNSDANNDTIQVWKTQLSQAGLVDNYDYEKHMKPITGTGAYFDASGKRGANALADVRSRELQEDLVKEVDRQLESIALTADCMDQDIAHALFDDFDEGDYEELNDEFVLDAATVVEGEEEMGFDFAAHIKGLIEKAKMESAEVRQLATVHEKGREDQDFFSRTKPLGDRDDDDDDDEYANMDGDLGGGDWDFEGTPGVVPQLSEFEEKALCEKFEETLLEYDSDDIGQGADDEEAMGLLPLEGDQQVEAALDEYLEEKRDEIFMAGARHYLAGENGTPLNGGSGFAALVGTRMVPVKDLDDNADVQGEIRPISDVLGEADALLGGGRFAPPAEEIFIDGKSYFSEKMRNPWDCESILSTYSNLDNNPVTIGAGSGRRRRKNNKTRSGGSMAPDDEAEQQQRQQILLSEKTGLPLGVLPVREDDEDDYGMDTFLSVNKGEARGKNEGKEEKRLRKLGVKKERQMARMQKKMMKEAFNDEFTKRQMEVMVDDVGGKSIFRF
jgi:protein LTV1